jgi:excinuclease ABC subunit C
VASCVVFRDGKPSRREYRHFNINTVVGADDFASMREIVSRRYTRLLEEEKAALAALPENLNPRPEKNSAESLPSAPSAEAEAAPPSILPDLVVVDGGKGQLSAAYGVFQELGIADRVPLVGLAKRIEEVFFPSDPMPYYLSRNGEPLKVMMHIRDEAHRFGITFHRNKRSADFIRSELENIPGVGEKSVAALLSEFKTVAAIKKASPEELARVVGTARAAAIRDYFTT